jgi:hypothetical protein
MFKLGEAADCLGLSRRKLQEFLSAQPLDEKGNAFYRVVNGMRVFDPDDIARLRDAIGVNAILGSNPLA